MVIERCNDGCEVNPSPRPCEGTQRSSLPLGCRRDRVDAATVERVTPREATDGEPQPAQDAVRAKRVDRVLAAGGNKLAGTAQKRANHSLVATHQKREHEDNAVTRKTIHGWEVRLPAMESPVHVCSTSSNGIAPNMLNGMGSIEPPPGYDGSF